MYAKLVNTLNSWSRQYNSQWQVEETTSTSLTQGEIYNHMKFRMFSQFGICTYTYDIIIWSNITGRDLQFLNQFSSSKWTFPLIDSENSSSMLSLISFVGLLFGYLLLCYLYIEIIYGYACKSCLILVSMCVGLYWHFTNESESESLRTDI